MTMGFVAATVVGAAGSLISGNAKSKGAEGAANAQVAAANTAEGQITSGYNTVSSLESPGMNLGYGAENILGQLFGINTGGGTPNAAMGGAGGGPSSLGNPSAGNTSPNTNFSSFYNSPGYQYAINQAKIGTNALSSAGGGLFSSTALNALNTNVQGVASGQYNNYVQQLLAQAGIGQQAVGVTAGAAQSAAANNANLTVGKGAAVAGGVLGNAAANAGEATSVGSAITPALINSIQGMIGGPNSSGVGPQGNGSGTGIAGMPGLTSSDVSWGQ